MAKNVRMPSRFLIEKGVEVEVHATGLGMVEISANGFPECGKFWVKHESVERVHSET